MARAAPRREQQLGRSTGAFTDNGRPLVAGDPHQPLRSPTIFYAQHLRARDGSLDTAGFSFVGTPWIQLGYNQDVAWTATTTYPDWMDLVEVQVGEGTIQVGDRTHELVTRTEIVNVRDGEPIEVEVQSVPGLGVLLPRDFSPLPITRPGRRIFLRWVGFAPSSEAHAFRMVDESTSLAEFEAGVDAMELGAFNFVAADADDITYRSAPSVPDRGEPGTFPRPWVLVDGDDPGAAWTGALLPAEKLPRSDVDRGWIGTANNDPFGFTSDGSVEGDAWYYGVWFDPGPRAARIDAELQRLTERGDVSVDDMLALQLDTYYRSRRAFSTVAFRRR